MLCSTSDQRIVHYMNTNTNITPTPGIYILTRNARPLHRQRIELLSATPIAEAEGWTTTKATANWFVISYVPAESIIGTPRIWACSPDHLIAD
jgi:hypothetical protein